MFTGWIYDYLKPHAAVLKVAHPLMLRAIAAAKEKNDRIDAGKICDCLRCDFLRTLPDRGRRGDTLGQLGCPRNIAPAPHLSETLCEGQTLLTIEGLYASYGCAGLLLRSAKSLATRHKRKHQSTVTAILPPTYRTVCSFA
jgi:hypothetical protein